MTTRKEPVGLDGVVDQISRMTQQLLEEGAEPSLGGVRFDVRGRGYGSAADERPFESFSVAVGGDREQAKCRLRKKQEEDGVGRGRRRCRRKEPRSTS